MNRRSWLLLSLATLIGTRGVCAQPAQVAAAPGAALFSNSAPIDVSAHTQTRDGPNHIILDGQVDITQAEARLRSPHVEIFTFPTQDKTGSGTMGKIEHAEAEGPVFYITPTQQARGDHGYYQGSDDTIRLNGHVVLLQGQNVTTGDQLVTNQKTGVATLTGTGKERTRGVFYPQKSK